MSPIKIQIMRYFITIWTLLLISFAITTSLHAQIPIDTSIHAQVKTTDGSRYIGKIITEGDTSITLSTQNVGEIAILKRHIKKIDRFDTSRMKDGKYWFENPNKTRNLFGPTGYNLEEGEGYYQNFMVLLNSFNVGITDNVSVGGGIIPIGFGSGLGFIFTPKFGIPVREDEFNAGGGLLYAHLWGEHAGIVYGIGTYGNTDNNFTLGLGYGFANGEWTNYPIVTMSGMLRIDRKFGLVTENWIIPTEYETITIFTYGLRYISEGVTVDLCFLLTGEISDSFPIGFPIVGVMIPFGRR